MGRLYWDYRDRVALSYVTGERVLDAGCGEGVTLERLLLARRDLNVEGIDIDPDDEAICREHSLPVQQGSVYDLPYEDASFDTCLHFEVIEHLDHPDRAIAELARVTRRGGRVLVLYPVDWTMYLARVLCLRWREARFDPGHVRQWSARALGRPMASCGLRPIARRCLPFWPPMMLHGLVVGRREA